MVATCETESMGHVESPKRPFRAVLIACIITAIVLSGFALAYSRTPSPGRGGLLDPLSSPRIGAPNKNDGTTFLDDFDGTAIDETKWELNNEWGCCGLSKESDLMSGSGVSVSDGVMTLVAERGSTPSGRAWRSAVVSTRDHFAQLYGVFRARMKWSRGNGLWPAFWLLQAGGAGPRPELDIVEAYPDTRKPADANRFNAVNHYRDASGNMREETRVIRTGVDLTADWHIYELEWRKESLVVRFDGIEVGRFTSNIPSVPMFMVLDMVVGSPASRSDATTPSPAFLAIDWVQVTK